MISQHIIKQKKLQTSSSPLPPSSSAREQQSLLTSSLRSLGVDVLELPPDEGSPDSAFAEDLAVVVNGIALMCRPGPHRMAEVRDTYFVYSMM